jgi:hypothetical protein
MRALPIAVKRQIQEHLWSKADGLDWPSLTVIEKTKQYGVWVNDAEIGGVLAAYMDARRVRIYIKDTLMKPYARARDADSTSVLSALGLAADTGILDRYERPHGLLLDQNRVISWGKADDWKLVLMATHERAFHLNGEPLAAVLTRFITAASRAVIEDAAHKLGISALGWHDPHDRLEGSRGPNSSSHQRLAGHAGIVTE